MQHVLRLQPDNQTAISLLEQIDNLKSKPKQLINMIKYPIVKPVLPELGKYQRYIESSFERCWLTNKGPLHQELEVRLAEYLGVENLMLVANGTLALQVAYKALELQGDVITTPFSFAATAGSLKWQNLRPEFVDVDPTSLNLCPKKIDEFFSLKNTSNVNALVAVHVFGNPCEVDRIDELAQKHRLKVIYDAAHAFGSQYKKQSLLNYGDASTLSLHATKIFHCVEGGAIIFKCKETLEKAKQLINFGFDSNNNPQYTGINAKMSEMHAAMGLALFDRIDEILQKRQALVYEYKKQLNGYLQFQTWHAEGENNGAYMPVVFDSEQSLLSTMQHLTYKGIQSRRYFYPSLSEVPAYGMHGDTPIANDISRRILCLPMYFDLSKSTIGEIANVIKASFRDEPA